MIYQDLRVSLRKAAYTCLSEFFLDEASAPIIFSHLNGPEPTSSYVIINILSATQKGRSYVSTLTNELGELAYIADYEISVQFAFCGNLSGEMAHSFSHKLGGNPVVRESLARNNLGYLRKSSIRRSPQRRETEWVEYNNMDVTFSYTVSSLQLVDVIEHVLLKDNTTGDEQIIPPLP